MDDIDNYLRLHSQICDRITKQINGKILEVVSTNARIQISPELMNEFCQIAFLQLSGPSFHSFSEMIGQIRNHY